MDLLNYCGVHLSDSSAHLKTAAAAAAATKKKHVAKLSLVMWMSQRMTAMTYNCHSGLNYSCKSRTTYTGGPRLTIVC